MSGEKHARFAAALLVLGVATAACSDEFFARLDREVEGVCACADEPCVRDRLEEFRDWAVHITPQPELNKMSSSERDKLESSVARLWSCARAHGVEDFGRYAPGLPAEAPPQDVQP